MPRSASWQAFCLMWLCKLRFYIFQSNGFLKSPRSGNYWLLFTIIAWIMSSDLLYFRAFFHCRKIQKMLLGTRDTVLLPVRITFLLYQESGAKYWRWKRKWIVSLFARIHIQVCSFPVTYSYLVTSPLCTYTWSLQPFMSLMSCYDGGFRVTRVSSVEAVVYFFCASIMVTPYRFQSAFFGLLLFFLVAITTKSSKTTIYNQISILWTDVK